MKGSGISCARGSRDGCRLSIGDTLWDWERGEGHAIELHPHTYDGVARRVETTTILKIERFVDLVPGLFSGDRIVGEGVKSFDDLSVILLP